MTRVPGADRTLGEVPSDSISEYCFHWCEVGHTPLSVFPPNGEDPGSHDFGSMVEGTEADSASDTLAPYGLDVCCDLYCAFDLLEDVVVDVAVKC